MATNRISLEQWRALVAVVDAGGYAQAAEALNKSQSTVTYAVKKLESLLGVHAFEIEGRRAQLTSTGQLLYRRARALLEEASRLERVAQSVSAGWEAQIGLGVEVLFPTWLLLDCLDVFGQQSPHTHIELFETVLGGAQEVLLDGRVDLALTPHIPVGFLGDPIMQIRFVPVAQPEHPLHRLNRQIRAQDLRRYRHLVVRESGVRRTQAVSLEAEQRWTVSNMATSIDAVCRGYGFAWFPEEKIRRELADGRLKPLPLADGGERFLTMYIVFADPDCSGPGVRHLAEIIRTAAVKRERKQVGALENS